MRKVYSLLSIQLAITTLIGATLLLTPGVKEMVQVRETTFLTFFLYPCCESLSLETALPGRTLNADG
jgi:FtsH-binding integral membrane protein